MTDKLPPIFPCGCSRNKVRAGLCESYDTDGFLRDIHRRATPMTREGVESRKDRGDIYAGDTRLLHGRHPETIFEVDPSVVERAIKAAVSPPARPPKPEPPPNRMERLTLFGVKRWNQGDPEPPGTMAAAFAELGDRWQAFKAEVLGAMASDLERIQWLAMRLFRRIYWRRSTGTWPVLCSNPACITVVSEGLCDRHAVKTITAKWAVRGSVTSQKNVQLPTTTSGGVDAHQAAIVLKEFVDELALQGLAVNYLTARANVGEHGLVVLSVETGQADNAVTIEP